MSKPCHALLFGVEIGLIAASLTLTGCFKSQPQLAESEVSKESGRSGDAVRDMATFLEKAPGGTLRAFGGLPSFRREKTSRLLTGRSFTRFSESVNDADPAFEKRYAGLALGSDLKKQIAYQLFRAKVVRDKRKEDPDFLVVQSKDRKRVGFVTSKGKHSKAARLAFRTPYFQELKEEGATALASVTAALERQPAGSHDERVELLRLAFMLGQSVPALAEQAKALLLDEALPDAADPAMIPKSARVNAMNFHNQLEKDPKRRQVANASFAAAFQGQVMRVGRRTASAGRK